jgi:hypothetical protein
MKLLEYYGANIAGIQNHTKVIHVMKNAKTLSLILPLAFTCQSLAQKQPRDIIQANYDKISKLSMTREKVRLEKLTRKNASSCFVYIDSMRNSLDLGATIMQNNDQLSRVFKFNSNTNKIIGVKKVGPDLQLTVKTNYDVFLDESGTKRVTGTTISQDIWIKTLKGWKIRQSKIMKESSFQNGKPIL